MYWNIQRQGVVERDLKYESKNIVSQNISKNKSETIIYVYFLTLGI